MVGDNIALTAARCVYDSSATISSITVILGKNGSTNPYGTSTVTTRIIPSKFTDNPSSGDFDWAILILNNNIGNSCG